jgi:hypothetical protein
VYANGKWDLLKLLFQEWGEERVKENDGGGEFNCKNFCKCHNVPLAKE